ncbi:MAG: Spy/CpxP family protein refolding chaperone [Longimicrobiales bacterium]
MTMKRWTTALAMLALAAGPVAGQQMRMGAPGQHGAMKDQATMQMCHAMMGDSAAMQGHSMMGGEMTGMMQGMGSGPAAILSAAERLQLTPEQKAQLQGLAKTADENHRTHMQAVMAAHQRAADALAADSPDLEAYERDLQEAAGHMVQAHVDMTRASLEARAVLTPLQRTEMGGDLALMGPMMCGMMGAQPGGAGGHAQHHR